MTTAEDLAGRISGSLVDARKLADRLGTGLVIVALLAAFLIASLLTLSSVAKRIRTGTVWVNDYHLLSAFAPFGGYKQSGIGRELGVWGLREYQQTKYIHVDQTPRKDQKFWYQIAGL